MKIKFNLPFLDKIKKKLISSNIITVIDDNVNVDKDGILQYKKKEETNQQQSAQQADAIQKQAQVAQVGSNTIPTTAKNIFGGSTCRVLCPVHFQERQPIEQPKKDDSFGDVINLLLTNPGMMISS